MISKEKKNNLLDILIITKRNDNIKFKDIEYFQFPNKSFNNSLTSTLAYNLRLNTEIIIFII